MGFKGAQAEKGGSQGEILPPNKEEPAYRQSCPEMEGASSNCGVSGLRRKPCKQRRPQLPVAGALPEGCLHYSHMGRNGFQKVRAGPEQVRLLQDTTQQD